MDLQALIEKIIVSVVPVFLISGIGFFYARYKFYLNHKNKNINNDNKDNLNLNTLNAIMLEITSPLLLLTALSDKSFNIVEQRWVILGGIAVVLGSGLIAGVIARFKHYDFRSFVLPAMFNNCGNMGLPLALFAFGQEGLKAAVALFMACNVLQMTIGIKLLSPKANVIDVLKTPLTIGMFTGLMLNIFNIHLPAALFEGLKLLGHSAIPMMLFMLGIRMAQTQITVSKASIVCAILNPIAGILMAYTVSFALPLNAYEFAYVLLFASLPPAVINTLMATRYNADAVETMNAVIWGHLVSLIAVPIAVALGFMYIKPL